MFLSSLKPRCVYIKHDGQTTLHWNSKTGHSGTASQGLPSFCSSVRKRKRISLGNFHWSAKAVGDKGQHRWTDPGIDLTFTRTHTTALREPLHTTSLFSLWHGNGRQRISCLRPNTFCIRTLYNVASVPDRHHVNEGTQTSARHPASAVSSSHWLIARGEVKVPGELLPSQERLFDSVVHNSCTCWRGPSAPRSSLPPTLFFLSFFVSPTLVGTMDMLGVSQLWDISDKEQAAYLSVTKQKLN